MVAFLTMTSRSGRCLKVSLNCETLSNLKYARIFESWADGAAWAALKEVFKNAVLEITKCLISPENGSLKFSEFPRVQKSDLAKKEVFNGVWLTCAPFICRVSVLFAIEKATWFQSIRLNYDLKFASVVCLKLGETLIVPFLNVVFWLVITLKVVPLRTTLRVFPQSRRVPLE